MRYLLVAALLAVGLAVVAVTLVVHVPEAQAQVSIGVGLPSINIGISVPVFPTFTVVPDYPVYYAPQANANLFFYDGLYWVYQEDHWYASSWYNGPWAYYEPQYVPDFILRVPVRYYVSPPIYFRGWEPYGPPRWGEHWGGGWDRDRRGWDQWDRSQRVAPAPLPTYQRQYSGDRYPRAVEQQAVIHERNYKYRPQDPVVQQQQRGRQQPAAGEQQQRGRQQGERPQPPAVEQPRQQRERQQPPVVQQQPQERQQPAVQERPQERQRPGPPTPVAAPTPEPQRGREQRAQQPQPQPQREVPQAPRQMPPVERPAGRLPPQQAVQPAPQPQRQEGPPVVQHQQAAPQQPQERQQRDAPQHQPQHGQEPQGRGQEQGRGEQHGR